MQLESPLGAFGTFVKPYLGLAASVGVESLQIRGVRRLTPWVCSPLAAQLPDPFVPGVPEPLPQAPHEFPTLLGWATALWLSP